MGETTGNGGAGDELSGRPEAEGRVRRRGRQVPSKADITPALAAELVASQFPQWGHLPITPVAQDGWDNTTFRLGDDLSVRLPSGASYAMQVDKEHRWLPVLGPQLPLAVPCPRAKGEPGAGYPWRWSIYEWLDGEPAGPERVEDLVALATELAEFLTALYAVDPTGGPAPGVHSAFRGGPLTVWDEMTRKTITDLADVVDGPAALTAWESALRAHRRGPPVWFHGDVAPTNLLLCDGRLAAVIDFGCSGVGDPACDLVIAWTFFSGESRAAFRRQLALDEATWVRGRGWALWKALITLAKLGPDATGAEERFGWRWDAAGVVEEVLAEHRETT